MSGESREEESGYLELWFRNQNFRRLFMAQAVSLFGDWFNLFALLALLRAIGHDSATSFALILVLKSLPVMLVTPIAGVVADRYSRRTIMMVCDVARAALVASVLVVLWWPSTLFVYAVVAGQTMVSAFFIPARTALLPDLVSARELTAANAMGAALWSTMMAFGSALGGLVTSWLGWEWAIALDVLTYLLSAVFVWGLHEPAWDRVRGSWLDSVQQFKEGARYLMQRGEILTLALVKSAWSIAGGMTIVLTVLGERVFSKELGDPILAVTILYMARGVGTGLGPFMAREAARGDRGKMERLIGVGFLLGGAMYLVLSHAPTVVLAVAGLVLAHIGGATVWVFSTIRLQQCVPTHIRGRVFSIELACFTVASACSTLVFAYFLDQPEASPRWVGSWLGVLLLMGGTYWFARMKRYPPGHETAMSEGSSRTSM